MATATKTRAKKKTLELAPNAFKEREATIKYECISKQMVKDAIAASGLSTRELQAALARIGVELGEASLTNKISRGAYSAAFLLQLYDALGLKLEAKPKR